MSDDEDIDMMDRPMDTINVAARNREIEALGMDKDKDFYEKIEKEFQKFMSELMQNNALAEFRDSYQTRFSMLQSSYENEKDLIKKCKKLTQKLYNKELDVKRAQKTLNFDLERIEQLKEKVNKSYEDIEKAKLIEEDMKEQIAQDKQEIA